MAFHQQKTDPKEDALQFLQDTPDISQLAAAYEETRSQLTDFLEAQQNGFDTRFNIWPGKSRDNRKHARATTTQKPFPWDGASDQDVWLVDNAIRTHVDMLMNSINKADFMATPVEDDDIERSAVVSNFMKWMLNTKIKEFKREMEVACNHLLEKGLMVTFQYWEQKEERTLQTFTLEDLAQQDPELAQSIISEEFDKELTSRLSEALEVSKKKAKKFIIELRETGQSSLGIPTQTVNRPAIKALAPDEDVFFPAWTIDPQDAPYFFVASYHSPQELRAKVRDDGWNEDWVEYAINNLQATHNEADIDYSRMTHRERNIEFNLYDDQTIRVIYCYQKLHDEDGIPGIYCTVFHPQVHGDNAGHAGQLEQTWAKHQLLDYAHGRYPIVVTKLEEWSKRLYETRSYAEVGRSLQHQLKVEIDSQIDRNSLATLPPLQHPIGRPPKAWGPGVWLGVRSPGEYSFADIPNFDQGTLEMREEIKRQFNKYFGFADDDSDPVEISNKQQALMNRVFSHLSQALDQIWSLYQQYGPDEEYFRVIGVNEIQRFQKGEASNRYDFYFSFDASNQDPSNVIEKATATAQLGSTLDKNGVLDTESLLKKAVGHLWPGWDELILPQSTASQKMYEEERRALTEVKNGFPLDVKENDAHEVKMQIAMQWAQQPDIQEALQEDEAFAARFEDYMKKRQFQVQQKQNAVIGRLGGPSGGFGAAS